MAMQKNLEHENEGCFGLFNGPTTIDNERERIAREHPAGGSVANPPVEEVLSMIASDMSKLSFQEREKAENDVHGIGDHERETPELIERCLQELDTVLQGQKRGTAFELAEAMNRAYTSDREFRTLFLRAERFNVREACERMIRFFELKKNLFGHERLVKEITQNDMSEDDMEALKSGGVQLCPAADSAGRPIVAIMLGLRKYKAVENMQRASFYMYMTAIRAMVSPQLGFVNISYAVGTPRFESIQGPLRRAIPAHIACQHFAYDHNSAYGNATVAIYMMSKRHRVRFRSHKGSHIECQYALTTFGIPRDAMPVDGAGNLYTDFHLSWLDKQREREESQVLVIPARSAYFPPPTPNTPSVGENVENGQAGDSTSPTSEPRPSDILFGRGKAVVEHPGNAWFRDLVDKTMLQYESCSRMEKASLAEMIVDMVKRAGGRFLKPEDDGDAWEEVDDHTARKKVAHTFRNRRKFHNIRNHNTGPDISMGGAFL